MLEDTHKVTELGIRVRFLVASHLEQALKTLFPLGAILPFGSTVSGIGRQTGDLDLVLLPNKVFKGIPLNYNQLLLLSFI